MRPAFCGIDIGTQGARCVLVADDGRLLAAAEKPFPPAAGGTRQGWFEQQPEMWTRAAAEAVRGALSAAGRVLVAAVGVTGTSGTLCALDADHRPVAPAIMYNDARSRPEAERVQQAGASLAARLGYRFSSSFALPKILWLRLHRADLYSRVASFISPTDYVIGWLTDVWGRSDQTNALKWGYDLLSDCWPEFIERELGISPSLLPRVQKPGELAGRVTGVASEKTALPAGAPVVAGMTDGCASQISSGAAAPGQYNTTIGTTMVVKGVSEQLLLDPAGRIYCHRHPQGWWLPGGASNTGAECLAVEFGPDETERRSARALRHSPTRVVCYPLLGRGERFPFMRPEAAGFVLGTPRDRDELFCAYLEGVACLERLAFETLEGLGARVGDTIYSAGGGSRSDAWLQIRADTLGKRVCRPRAPGAATGAAILAASFERYDSLREAACAMVRIEREVEPRRDFSDIYGEKYEQFKSECRARGYLDAP